MTRETLLALAAKVEALAGPCRETDALIRAAVFAPADATVSQSPFNAEWCIYSGVDRTGRPRLCERPHGVSFEAWRGEYTSSIDAARTIMARGTLWAVGSMEDGPFARLCHPMPDGTFVGGYVEGRGATAELALCAAALRARAAS